MTSSLFRSLARFSPSRHLRIRLGLTTASTALLLALLLSSMVGYVSSLHLETAVQQSLNELAYQMADKLDRGMFERYRDIQIASTLDPMQQPDVSVAEKRSLLNTLQDTYPDYAWIGVTDAQGTVIASTDGLLEGAIVAERPWFKQALAQPFVGDVHEAVLLAKLLPNPSNEPLRFVDVATPIRDRQGQFTGVLGAHLSWQWANEIQHSLLAPIEQQRNIEIFILDQNGKILLQPPGFVGETVDLALLPRATTAMGAAFWGGWRSRPYLSGIAQSQGYRDYPGLGWQVYIRQPSAVALAPARLLQFQVLGWGVALGLVAALWNWRRSRSIVDPILRLIAAADAMRRGHTAVSIPVFRRRDEIAVLSESLHDLVTTLEQQQASLRQSNQQLQDDIVRQKQDAATIREQAALLNIATDAIFVRDLNWKIQFWNRGAERLYGWTAAEAYHQDANQLLNGGASAHLEQALHQVLEEGEWQGELKKLTKLGQERIVASRWALVRGENDQPRAILAVDTDITEKKQLEEQVLRTQRLESLGTLASGIAHDLNNILTPILVAVQLLPLRLPDLDAPNRRLLDTLNVSARRGSSLVKQILSFARGMSDERSPVQVKHVLSEILQIVTSTFPKAITLTLSIRDKTLWMIEADANQVHQVLMNLCVNARDAMPSGGHITLTAENYTLSNLEGIAEPDAKPGCYVRIGVIDTGTGMPPEIIEQIFDPFFTTKALDKGTGLGLSTTRGIMKRHGGFITVTSQVDQGTQFHLYFPAEPDQCDLDTAETSLIAGQNELILVVDDETRIAETLRESLETYNYRVMTASNGVTAIERYTRHQRDIQLVLTDMMMPDMGGEELVRLLHTLNPDLKIMVASGSQQVDAQSLQVDAFLSKPYHLEDLLAMIHQVLHPA